MKNVYGNIYFALEALEEIPLELKNIYQEAKKKLSSPFQHNLVKIEKDRKSVTLLNYPHLDTHAHPYLKCSLKISLDKLVKVKLKNESKDNPVILHRIELMLSGTNPRIKDLAKLTEHEEKHSLYDSEHIKFIGRRKYWNKICRELNLTNSVSPEDNLLAQQLDLFGQVHSPIKRAKTAMSTKTPSAPTKILFEKNIIKNKVLDWGCGKGRDSKFLVENGFDVLSYDKYHKPTPDPHSIDFSEINTILLNYVLNVIENQNERTDLLKEIYSYANNKCLVLISVRSKKEIETFAKKSNWKNFNDGYITTRNTFQKGFTQDELSKLIENLIEIIEIIDNRSYIYCIGKIKK